MLLQDKVVSVTGAGSGIGRASARVFTRDDAQVCLFDIDAGTNAATAALITEDGYQARCWQVDVANEDSVAEAVTGGVQALGRLDGAFNNAGIEMANKSVTDLTMDDWLRMMAINLNGVFLCLKHQTKAMSGTGGVIVNMSSGDGIIGAPLASDYVAAKHGVVGLTRAAACEARHTGVRVNAVLPGLTRTPQAVGLTGNPEIMAAWRDALPLGRAAEPAEIAAEIAAAIAFLASDDASYVNGHDLVVDGGGAAHTGLPNFTRILGHASHLEEAETIDRRRRGDLLK